MSGARFGAGEREREWSFCCTSLTFLHVSGAVAWFDPRLTFVFLYNLPHSPLHTEIKAESSWFFTTLFLSSLFTAILTKRVSLAFSLQY